MPNLKDYYAELGIPHDASTDEVREAFRRLAKQWHPDLYKAPDAEARFKRINEAYQVLSDSGERERYDRALAYSRQEQGSRTQGPAQPNPAQERIHYAWASAREQSESTSDDKKYRPPNIEKVWPRFLIVLVVISAVIAVGYGMFETSSRVSVVLTQNKDLEIVVDRQNREVADIVAASVVVSGSCGSRGGDTIVARDCDEIMSIWKPLPQGFYYEDWGDNDVFARTWNDYADTLTIRVSAAHLPSGRYEVHVWQDQGRELLDEFGQARFTVD